MTKPAFNRDNILTQDERDASARKCVALLEPYIEDMSGNESYFVEQVTDKIERWGVTERQLAWLRDLCEKYAQ
jgi:hypothetical protein